MMESLDRGHFNDAWLVLAVFCTVTAVIRRITSCRVVLVPGQVLIENPLSSYVIPVEFISEVEMSSGGGLKIETFRGEKIRPLVFAGSVIDAYFKTTERAIVEIRRMLGGNAAAPPENPQVQHKFRWCWSADVPLFLGIFAGAWTVVS
ncbi:hypothetical protein [Streptomyces lycii]|uniref:GPI-GlcNAc transferase complex PIG-H component conserved domain-containing protein n=1 Tax=Streptomyces lycii TaxID=2654337 RepID=A0ABQ7FMT6_9ACTN|nr:hypothetical protein [Streptomyces lycii]KAF4408919.1 hypothetical protein GCU69_11580 [Streptomyces lycii]